MPCSSVELLSDMLRPPVLAPPVPRTSMVNPSHLPWFNPMSSLPIHESGRLTQPPSDDAGSQTTGSSPATSLSAQRPVIGPLAGLSGEEPRASGKNDVSKPRSLIVASADSRSKASESAAAALQTWVKDVLGPTYDANEYANELRKHADKSEADRKAAIETWLRRRALHVAPSEHALFAALRPEFVNAGVVFNAVYKLPGHPLVAKIDMLQPRVQAGYNMQFMGREPNYEPVHLAAMAQSSLRQERRNLREMRSFFGSRVPREFLRYTTVPVPGRILKLLAQEESAKHESVVDGQNVIYAPMPIDCNRIYPMDLVVRFQKDISELYDRVARGDDAISFRGHYIEDPSHRLPDADDYQLASDLWVDNKYPGREFGPDERMLFEKIHGLAEQDTLSSLLLHCDDPDLLSEVRDLVSLAIRFSNSTKRTLDTIGDGNVFFVKIDGQWTCVMGDAQVPRLEPMLATFSDSLNKIARDELPNANAGWHLMVGLPYVQSVNAVAHFLGLTERIRIPGGVPAHMPWDRVLSLLVSGRRPSAPHAVIPFQDRPLWRRPPEIW
jgi:hypothetical protein